MKRREKKEAVTVRFSYLDVFFLLLAGCVLSLGIYFFAEDSEAKENISHYCVEARAEYREELYSVIPIAEETVYDSEGRPIGTVASCTVSGSEVWIELELAGVKPNEGETMTLETARAVKEVEIIRVTKTEKGGAV
ncbi:MAG: hypothetical protein IKC69_05550 [Clostridia bacterium]|nr:hypothetical protein [Clostridia bacterium]